MHDDDHDLLGPRRLHAETIAARAGHGSSVAPDVVPPIHVSTTFERAPDGDYPSGYMYTRHGNPNREALEDVLARLEGGKAALAFASGSAATMSVMQTLGPGDRVLAPRDVYHGTRALLDEVFGRWGVQTHYVDMMDLELVERALEPGATMVWLENPSNPMLRITDVAAIAALGKKAGALVVCDNTWATPMGQRPFELGCDWVLHSTTKYLSGHSDVLGGALVTRHAIEDDAHFSRAMQLQVLGGAVPAPMDCWLTLRGLRTLALRMRAHHEGAMELAHVLARHRRVQAVHYPGLPTHPQHALARDQMALMGGMVAVQIEGGEQAAMRVAARVRLFTRATSLGGPESLIEHRASIEGSKSTTPRNLLRISVGLEHPEDLCADMIQALEED